MNKLGFFLVSAAICTTAASADAPRLGCLLSARSTPIVDRKHPLIDGLGTDHVTGFHVTICARDASDNVVTREQAIVATRAFLKDNDLDCRLANARQFHVGRADLEWNVDMECQYNPKSPLMVPPPEIKQVTKP